MLIYSLAQCFVLKYLDLSLSAEYCGTGWLTLIVVDSRLWLNIVRFINKYCGGFILYVKFIAGC